MPEMNMTPVIALTAKPPTPHRSVPCNVLGAMPLASPRTRKSNRPTVPASTAKLQKCRLSNIGQTEP
jgi:hypothetical protein